MLFLKLKKKLGANGLIRAKILFEYSTVAILSLILGIWLSRFASPLLLHEKAIAHFSLPFRNFTFSEAAQKILLLSLPDLLCIFVSVAFFSVMPYLVTDLILAYQGLRMGFLLGTLPILATFCHDGKLLLLTMLRLWIFYCFFRYAYRSSVLFQGKQSNFSKQILLSAMVTVVAIVSAIICYCGLIYLI